MAYTPGYNARNQIWTEQVLGGGVKVHVPDVVGLAHIQGGIRQLDQQMGIRQPEGQVIRDQNGRVIFEGPDINSPDAYRRPESRQVPYAPGMPNVGQQPMPGWGSNPGVPSPGFSSVPPSTQGYDVAPGTVGQPWNQISRNDWMQTPESVRALVRAVANPNPIKDAKGEEEEEEARRHSEILRNIRSKYNLELGPIASDGNQISAVGAQHKHLPSNDGKVSMARAVGIDNQPHAAQAGQFKKLPGEAKIDVGKDEEEEEERFKAHAGITCEKAHGIMPHKVYAAFANREGTSTMPNMVRGDPLNLPTPDSTSARQAAKKVGTTSSEAKSPEEEEEEEEEEERYQAAQYAIKMRRQFGQASIEGTAARPAQGFADPLNLPTDANQNPLIGATGKGQPASITGENRITQVGRQFGLERQVRDLGSGVPSVTINSLPQEYTNRMQFMTNQFAEMFRGGQQAGAPPRHMGESYQPVQNQQGYVTMQDPNRYPTASTSGMPANMQSAIIRSAGTINEIVAGAMQRAGNYSQNNQEKLNMAWKDVYAQYVNADPRIRQQLISQRRQW